MFRNRSSGRNWQKMKSWYFKLSPTNTYTPPLSHYHDFFKKIYLFLFLVALGLCCCTGTSSSCGERGLLFIAVRGLLIAGASLVQHGLQARGLSSCVLQTLERRLSSCGAQAQLLRGMWDLPGPGLEPVSPALAGRFLTSVPPGKPTHYHDYIIILARPFSFSSFSHSFVPTKVKAQKTMSSLLNLPRNVSIRVVN